MKRQGEKLVIVFYMGQLALVPCDATVRSSQGSERKMSIEHAWGNITQMFVLVRKFQIIQWAQVDVSNRINVNFSTLFYSFQLHIWTLLECVLNALSLAAINPFMDCL